MQSPELVGKDGAEQTKLVDELPGMSMYLFRWRIGMAIYELAPCLIPRATFGASVNAPVLVHLQRQDVLIDVDSLRGEPFPEAPWVYVVSLVWLLAVGLGLRQELFLAGQ